MASKSSFCGLQVSTLSKYKLLFLSYHSTVKWEQLMFTHRHTWLSYDTLWWHGRYEKHLGDKTSCVTVARCSTLKNIELPTKFVYNCNLGEDIKRLHYFKGTLSQLRLERTPESRYSCQKWKWFVASLLQPCHKIYQNSKSASKLLSVTWKRNAQNLWREGINNSKYQKLGTYG